MSDLLRKFLIHNDPVSRGWTLSGIANGVVATGGLSFSRRHGGVNLYRGHTVGLQDVIVGASSPARTAIEPYSWVRREAAQDYYYRATAIGGGGVEATPSQADPQIVLVATDAAGNSLDPVPSAPRNLRVAPLSGGRFAIAWTYTPHEHCAAVYAFRVYHNGGAGGVDYASSIGQVIARLGRGGEGVYSFRTDAYADGLSVAFGVRARTRAGAEEANMATASNVADATGPTGQTIKSVTVGGDE